MATEVMSMTFAEGILQFKQANPKLNESEIIEILEEEFSKIFVDFILQRKISVLPKKTLKGYEFRIKRARKLGKESFRKTLQNAEKNFRLKYLQNILNLKYGNLSDSSSLLALPIFNFAEDFQINVNEGNDNTPIAEYKRQKEFNNNEDEFTFKKGLKEFEKQASNVHQLLEPDKHINTELFQIPPMESKLEKGHHDEERLSRENNLVSLNEILAENEGYIPKKLEHKGKEKYKMTDLIGEIKSDKSTDSVKEHHL